MIIVDMDGCLSDDRWRRRFLPTHFKDQAAWSDYHSLCFSDPINESEIIQQIKSKPIVVFTARPEFVRIKTRAWLAWNGFNVVKIYMRPDSCNFGSVTLKSLMLNDLLHSASLSQIECAYDDREDVVEMYRNFGIKAEVLDVGRQNFK